MNIYYSYSPTSVWWRIVYSNGSLFYKMEPRMKRLMCREEFDTLSRLKSQYFESKTKDFTIPKTLKGFRNKILKVCMKDSYEYNSYISRKLGASSGSKTKYVGFDGKQYVPYTIASYSEFFFGVQQGKMIEKI